MAMNQATLAAALTDLAPTVVEADAANALASAYETYALGAVGNGVPILPSGPAAGKAVMVPALAGMSAPGATASVLQAAIVAFWVAAATPASFPGAVAVFPPPNTGVAASVQPVFVSNTLGSLSLLAASSDVAAVLHAQAILGGTVTLPGPSVGPIL